MSEIRVYIRYQWFWIRWYQFGTEFQSSSLTVSEGRTPLEGLSRHRDVEKSLFTCLSHIYKQLLKTNVTFSTPENIHDKTKSKDVDSESLVLSGVTVQTRDSNRTTRRGYSDGLGLNLQRPSAEIVSEGHRLTDLLLHFLRQTEI